MTIKYMLDTDIASYAIKGGMPSIDRRLRELKSEQVCISSVTRGELLYGICLKKEAHRLVQLVEQFLTRMHSIPWDNEAADHFGKLAAHLTQSGIPIGDLDTMIAAHALATEVILVTNNSKHFSRIPGLAIENWAHNH